MNEKDYTIKKEDFYRINIYKKLYDELSDRNEDLKYRLKNSIILLSELEYFINDKESFYSKLIKNKSDLTNIKNNDYQIYSKLMDKISFITEKDLSTKSMLNKILTAIDQYLDVQSYLELFSEVKEKRNFKNVVFLSHAYDDKSYTIGLFYFFLSKNIYLYVDWMHNGKILSGDVLKTTLSTVLNQSNQFLFLDTINSQLAMPGNYTIRQWCAWEVGNYFKFNINGNMQRKFYLSIYYDEQLDKRKEKNSMLADFEPVREVKNGLIY